jgi:MinD superfamily P-loop ATPase
MKEVVVISGKGGTGKTSLTASFASLQGEEVVVADCDVDAANLHLLLDPKVTKSEPFFSGQLATVDQELCSGCGKCQDICHFEAIKIDPSSGTAIVDPLSCEGCGYCARICPDKAITMTERQAGTWFHSISKTGAPMIHARLGIGAENSGKLVAKVKKEARITAADQNKPMVLVDGSPGIGCPVISSLTGASFVVLVTEPTISGFHDLVRVADLIKPFKVDVGCIVNKHDLNSRKTKQIHQWMKRENILSLADLPYNQAFTKAMSQGKTMMEWQDDDIREKIKTIWNKILNQL